uniref:Putative secreted protein n=1 Tax=Anopheles darlingi TaxID=43151 RepID=A0A2M4D3H3_ANODA
MIKMITIRITVKSSTARSTVTMVVAGMEVENTTVESTGNRRKDRILSNTNGTSIARTNDSIVTKNAITSRRNTTTIGMAKGIKGERNTGENGRASVVPATGRNV